MMRTKTGMNKVAGGLYIGDGYSASDEKLLLVNVYSFIN